MPDRRPVILTTLALIVGTNVSPARGQQCEANEFAKVVASDGATGDQFGGFVSISGYVAVIGAVKDGDSGTDSGAAYVYRFDGVGWAEEQKLIPSDGAGDDGFGSGVAVDGDVAVIGALKDDDNGADSGSAYSFRFDPGTGEWIQEQRLTASDGEGDDWFGHSVCISKNVAVITAPWDDEVTGSAYVFRRYVDSYPCPAGTECGQCQGAPPICVDAVCEGVCWVQEAKLVASDREASDHFGGSCSISEHVVVVGAYRDDNENGTDAGAAYVFVEPPEGWASATSPINENVKLIASDGTADDDFGVSVGVSGDVVVVGARFNDNENADQAGPAYVFEQPPDGWGSVPTPMNECAKLIASDAQQGDGFGRSVSIDGSLIVVGAYWDDGGEMNSGSAYGFLEPPGGWCSASSPISEHVKLTAFDAQGGNNLGISASISGSVGVIGAYHADGHESNSGAAYVFHGLSDCQPNGTLDICDIAEGTSQDANESGIPDECRPDVPAVSEWGLVVMSLLSLIAGTAMFRRKRRIA